MTEVEAKKKIKIREILKNKKMMNKICAIVIVLGGVFYAMAIMFNPLGIALLVDVFKNWGMILIAIGVIVLFLIHFFIDEDLMNMMEGKKKKDKSKENTTTSEQKEA